MTELEKIAYAKSFIDKLANGINPIDDSVIPADDTVNNVRLSRCFFYVSDILRQVIDNGGINPSPKPPKRKRKAYYLSPEQAEDFQYSDTPITATEIINRIIDIGPKEGVRKFPRKNLNNWLIYVNLIEIVEIGGDRVKRPTESGKEIGILCEERNGQYGMYYAILYTREAQQFIIDNIEAILAFDNNAYKAKMNLDNQGKIWDREQDERLVTLYNEGLSIREIAAILKRGETSIILRLRRHGIDPDAVIVE